jgi:two-component system sensor histidine kinase ChvG
MTAGFDKQKPQTAAGLTPRSRWLLPGLGAGMRIPRLHVFTSSITRRIIILNLAALVILVSGILFLNQFRAGLIESRVASLLIQGEIIAGAIASSATVETDSITIDPEELLDLQVGQISSPSFDQFEELDFSINPERIAPVLRRLISPTGTRARVYDRDGTLILDSRQIYARGRFLRSGFSTTERQDEPWVVSLWRRANAWMSNRDLPHYVELGGRNGRGYEEVIGALEGTAQSVVRINDQDKLIVSVALPIQRFQAVHGVLLLSTEGSDIDEIVYAERMAILRVFLVAAGVTVLLSLVLAWTIAAPLHRLAEAADRVRHRVSSRPEIPDFSQRRDEIGHLSRSVRDMTTALYDRIVAIEHFAADVAHEIKNPMTSLRSAVETLPLAKDDEARNRLSEIILHDIQRLDRLISDISDASRLDADLARQEAAPVDLRQLLTVIAEVNSGGGTRPRVELEFADPEGAYTVLGHDGRLGQVFNNVVDNACTFTRQGGVVTIAVSEGDKVIQIRVDDEGPGIRDDQFERIFERFYTDRADIHEFGDNSGLGLAISKQIVEAYGGTITAENRTAPTPEGEDDGGRPTIMGARLTVRLPTV